MRREYYECAGRLGKRGGGWRLAAIALFFMLAAVSAIALLLKIQNKKYCEALVRESEKFPNTPEQDEKLAEIREREWRRAHAPANRQTCEEKIAENRVKEEE